MPKILHINASPRHANSESLRLARHFIDSVRDAGPGVVDLETLDLFSDGALPAFGRIAADAKMAVFSGQGQTSEQAEAWESARAVFDQFAAADAYVFNIPMWNSGVPYVLKQWIDIITQPGWSFGFDPEKGYRGLMEGKQALAIHTSGVYAPGVPAAFGSDFSSTFFADWLNFVGIEDAAHVRFAPTVLNSDVDGTRRAAMAELSAEALGFAGKLSTMGNLQLAGS
ncbi:FMN-dependent NADH-azoreductase [Arthrobacter stackebrandtii]|uniref:FMN dependent NADH:quinone oxidoreductase n=1 Tax=Arthrobacter stackebrandtii TaxID=272161 RepID=A0ABS4YT93_9MICC|nr:NAD(P)H-dependent oxidoreductase [Arthrobacter stackebrandtii]MBP2411964.1 FMN-dependent NADH-azoreductase [Arthrobacter stackebrandtii]PYG99781.1 FMN-dependent NADH-azoreductase [Arthrobacter stackebrandtii]